MQQNNTPFRFGSRPSGTSGASGMVELASLLECNESSECGGTSPSKRRRDLDEGTPAIKAEKLLSGLLDSKTDFVFQENEL